MIGRALGLAVFALLFAVEPGLAHHPMGGATPTSFAHGLLSGLGHPIIGVDHLAAVIAVGCLAGTQPSGALLAVGYVIATMVGAAAHIGEATLPGAEIFVAASVIALGLIMFRNRALRADIALALFAFAGLVNGYALGESIVGAEQAPLLAYFIGLVAIQSAIALGAMVLVRMLTKLAVLAPVALRYVGLAVVIVGIAVLVQSFVSSA